MAELLFEIWKDAESGSLEMSPVSLQADKLRNALNPHAECVHSFAATTSFDASRKYYAWNDFGEWVPPEGLEDEPFSDAQARDQRRYLEERQK